MFCLSLGFTPFQFQLEVKNARPSHLLRKQMQTAIEQQPACTVRRLHYCTLQQERGVDSILTRFVKTVGPTRLEVREKVSQVRSRSTDTFQTL